MNFFKCCFTQYLQIIHLFIIISYQSSSLIGSFKIVYLVPPKYKECLSPHQVLEDYLRFYSS